MAQNLATKFSPKVDERFKLASLTQAAVNQNYDWTGVETVKVYSVDTVSMNNYTRSGANRYGSTTELGTAVQTLTLTRDRSFTFTIDRGNWNESMMVTEAGKALRRQIDEVVIPEVDIYRLAAINSAALANGAYAPTLAAVSASNAYQIVLELNEILSDAKVPLGGRILFITPNFYKFLKLDNNFVLASEMGQKIKINGQIGEVDGNAVVVVPSSYMPTNTFGNADTDAILTHRIATVAPGKLEDYKTHDNPPGINGWLVEGRLIYDAFVLDNKVDAIAVHNSSPSS